jgi:hypothetical protein
MATLTCYTTDPSWRLQEGERRPQRHRRPIRDGFGLSPGTGVGGGRKGPQQRLQEVERHRCGPRTKGFSQTRSRTTSPPLASEPAAKRMPEPPPSGRREPEGGQDLTFEIWCASGRGSPCTRTTLAVALPPARTRMPASTRERHRPHCRCRRSNPRPPPRRPKPPTPDAGR